MTSDRQLQRLLDFIVEHIGVPKSYYERAAARHRSLGEHLQREKSRIAHLDPDIRPQGSFRYGTVNRPIFEDEEYDLDNVCLLRKLNKFVLTQQQLKDLYGAEIRDYAEFNNMLAPIEELNRCWRLRYADEVSFHLDTLPCVPETDEIITGIAVPEVPHDLARRAVAITDKRHPQYRELTDNWLTSNPRGFAAWFEQRAALGRQRPIINGMRASIEDVPAYEWKTPLQRSIQIMKRHRDVMFREKRELAPISMILTNLAAHAYEGERDLLDALRSIVERMPTFVRATAPFIPNPTHLAEDYADKWRADDRLRKCFWEWHAAFSVDLERLESLIGRSSLENEVQTLFQVALTADEVRDLRPSSVSGPTIVTRSAPALVIPKAQRPWGHHG